MKENLSASVTFHPEKIIVNSINKTTLGLEHNSTKLTVLPIDTSADLLGETLRKHFNLCEFNTLHPKAKYRSMLWTEFKKAAGFKTDNDIYQNAKLVECLLTEIDIQLCPLENLYNTGNTGYIYLTERKISLPLTISNLDLGKNLFKTKELCKCYGT